MSEPACVDCGTTFLCRMSYPEGCLCAYCRIGRVQTERDAARMLAFSMAWLLCLDCGITFGPITPHDEQARMS